jgi:uncharacterized protein YjbI with pentapeptide repeats
MNPFAAVDDITLVATDDGTVYAVDHDGPHPTHLTVVQVTDWNLYDLTQPTPEQIAATEHIWGRVAAVSSHLQERGLWNDPGSGRFVRRGWSSLKWLLSLENREQRLWKQARDLEEQGSPVAVLLNRPGIDGDTPFRVREVFDQGTGNRAGKLRVETPDGRSFLVRWANVREVIPDEPDDQQIDLIETTETPSTEQLVAQLTAADFATADAFRAATAGLVHTPDDADVQELKQPSVDTTEGMDTLQDDLRTQAAMLIQFPLVDLLVEAIDSEITRRATTTDNASSHYLFELLRGSNRAGLLQNRDLHRSLTVLVDLLRPVLDPHGGRQEQFQFSDTVTDRAASPDGAWLRSLFDLPTQPDLPRGKLIRAGDDAPSDVGYYDTVVSSNGEVRYLSPTNGYQLLVDADDQPLTVGDTVYFLGRIEATLALSDDGRTVVLRSKAPDGPESSSPSPLVTVIAEPPSHNTPIEQAWELYQAGGDFANVSLWSRTPIGDDSVLLTERNGGYVSVGDTVAAPDDNGIMEEVGRVTSIGVHTDGAAPVVVLTVVGDDGTTWELDPLQGVVRVATVDGLPEFRNWKNTKPLEFNGSDPSGRIPAARALAERLIRGWAAEQDGVFVPPVDRTALRGANLNGRNLSGVDLSGYDLTGTKFEHANLSGANLTGADLTDAFLYEADLSGADLTGANLTKAFFMWASLEDANLTGADLTKAVLNGADLARANFTNATIKDTDFGGSDIRGAVFVGVKGGRIPSHDPPGQTGRRTVAAEGATKTAAEQIALALLSSINGAWADSSQSTFATGLQYAAAELVGSDTSGFPEWLTFVTSHQSYRNPPLPGQLMLSRAVALSTYLLTQQKLRDEGIGPDDMLLLWRGSSETDWMIAGDLNTPVKISTNPLSASATEFAAAASFGEVRLGMRVPASHLFSTSHTGPGTYREAEALILGSPDVGFVSQAVPTQLPENPVPTLEGIGRLLSETTAGSVLDPVPWRDADSETTRWFSALFGNGAMPVVSADTLDRYTDGGLINVLNGTLAASEQRQSDWKELVPDANLREANLSGANLSGADLSGADVYSANLRDADLTGANLTGAFLTGAELTGANLTGADLTGADAYGAWLIGAYLSNANLSGADLADANLTDAIMRGADLSGANLSGSRLMGATLTEANLTGADVRGSALRGANLSAANLRGADLTGANLRGANLTGADLRGANLDGVTLTDADLTGVVYDDTTVRPVGFTMPPSAEAPAAVPRTPSDTPPAATTGSWPLLDDDAGWDQWATQISGNDELTATILADTDQMIRYPRSDMRGSRPWGGGTSLAEDASSGGLSTYRRARQEKPIGGKDETVALALAQSIMGSVNREYVAFGGLTLLGHLSGDLVPNLLQSVSRDERPEMIGELLAEMFQLGERLAPDVLFDRLADTDPSLRTVDRAMVRDNLGNLLAMRLLESLSIGSAVNRWQYKRGSARSTPPLMVSPAVDGRRYIMRSNAPADAEDPASLHWLEFSWVEGTAAGNNLIEDNYRRQQRTRGRMQRNVYEVWGFTHIDDPDVAAQWVYNNTPRPVYEWIFGLSWPELLRMIRDPGSFAAEYANLFGDELFFEAWPFDRLMNELFMSGAWNRVRLDYIELTELQEEAERLLTQIRSSFDEELVAA